MADNIDDPDPLTAMARRTHDDASAALTSTRRCRASDAYRGAVLQVDRYILDYGLGINAIELMDRRNRPILTNESHCGLSPTWCNR
jgi:hypothetical protein